MQEVAITAEAGRPVGSRPSRRLRAQGKVPAVLYGHGVDPVSLAVDGRQLRGALTTEAGANALISLDVGGDRHLAMARELQRHPVRGGVTHVDFVIVRRDEVVSADVPIHLAGEAEAVNRADGMLEQSLFSLAIAAKPGDIPTSIEVDISGLEIGDSVRVGDLKLPSGVSTEVDPEEAVVVAQGAQVMALPEEGAMAGEEGVTEGAEPSEGGAEAGEGQAGSSGE